MYEHLVHCPSPETVWRVVREVLDDAELLVHLVGVHPVSERRCADAVAGDQPLPLERWLVSIDCPSQHWQERSLFNPDDWGGWNATPPVNDSTDWGNQWIAGRQSLLAQVPSVIVPEESNMLINPSHPSRFDLCVTLQRRSSYDHRLR